MSSSAYRQPRNRAGPESLRLAGLCQVDLLFPAWHHWPRYRAHDRDPVPPACCSCRHCVCCRSGLYSRHCHLWSENAVIPRFLVSMRRIVSGVSLKTPVWSSFQEGADLIIIAGALHAFVGRFESDLNMSFLRLNSRKGLGVHDYVVADIAEYLRLICTMRLSKPPTRGGHLLFGTVFQPGGIVTVITASPLRFSPLTTILSYRPG